MSYPEAPETVELTPDAAAAFLRDELALAADAQARGDVDAALDAYVRAVGLALQLGPAAVGQALAGLLDGARRMDADSLATLGPALVRLDEQVRQAGALPDNPVMDWWATVVARTGMVIGLAGVAGTLASDHRQGLVDKVRAAAAQIDEETGEVFDLVEWVDDVVGRGEAR